MDHKGSKDWHRKLHTIAKQDIDHLIVAQTVFHHTYSQGIRQRALAIAALISTAIAFLCSENDSLSSSIALVTAGGITGIGGIEIIGKIACEMCVRKLQREHPARLRLIFHEIREKISELTPVVNHVERALFDSSPSQEK